MGDDMKKESVNLDGALSAAENMLKLAFDAQFFHMESGSPEEQALIDICKLEKQLFKDLYKRKETQYIDSLIESLALEIGILRDTLKNKGLSTFEMELKKLKKNIYSKIFPSIKNLHKYPINSDITEERLQDLLERSFPEILGVRQLAESTPKETISILLNQTIPELNMSNTTLKKNRKQYYFKALSPYSNFMGEDSESDYLFATSDKYLERLKAFKTYIVRKLVNPRSIEELNEMFLNNEQLVPVRESTNTLRQVFGLDILEGGPTLAEKISNGKYVKGKK